MTKRKPVTVWVGHDAIEGYGAIYRGKGKPTRPGQIWCAVSGTREVARIGPDKAFFAALGIPPGKCERRRIT